MAETILLVDDEEGIRKVLSLSLREAGYRVLTAKSGQEALDVFARERPAIVLTDIKMPGMDGIEILRRIKSLGPDTEIIMITGHGDIDLAIQSIKLDATDFVTKPINDDILDIALRRAEQRLAMRRALRDHTENLERLVEEKTRELLAAERFAAVGQTAAGLSHAIKNIASGLEGSIFLLGQGRELGRSQYLEQGFEMLKLNVEKIKNLSLELLRLGAEPKPTFETTDPNHPAREVYDLLLPRATELGVALSLVACPDARPVRLDLEGIHRCLLNLTSNALDACAERGGDGREANTPLRTMEPMRVEIKVDQNRDFLEYSVSDTGGGIPEDVRAKLFTAFLSTKGEAGSGIGLLSTKKIIDAHGGSVTAENRPEGGAIFRLRLPEAGA
jgi:signal transduction histidine kinase